MDGRRLWRIIDRGDLGELDDTVRELQQDIYDCTPGSPGYDSLVGRFKAQIKYLEEFAAMKYAQRVAKIACLALDGCRETEPDGYRVNKREREVVDALKAEGYTVLRNGWPDFLAVRGNDTVAVEVKAPTDSLTNAQFRMHSALKAIGIETVVAREGENLPRRLR